MIRKPATLLSPLCTSNIPRVLSKSPLSNLKLATTLGPNHPYAAMPHHPSEETAPDNLTDKVAQHSRDSMASDHPLHDENKGPVESATANDFKSKGPQIVESKSCLPSS